MGSKNALKKVFDDFVISPNKTISSNGKSNEKLKILLVGAEASPYANVGGFASVLGYLSKELASQGHDVRIFMPKFGSIDEDKFGMSTIYKDLRVPTSDEATPELICNVKYVSNPEFGVPAYFLENMEYYEKRANVYGYSDDATRWALLSRGALEFIRTETFVPDVIHCHDWHTGIVSNYLTTDYKNDPLLANVSSVFTIHNLSYQGMFDQSNVSELDFDDGRSDIASFFSNRLNNQNFMKRGIIHSNVVNTVSKTYSKEILTEEFGEGLDKLLLELREKLFGIVNGIDYEVFNPATDPLVPQNYDSKSIDLRAINKEALQKEFNLPVDPNIPIFGFVGRLTHQKGIDMLVTVLTHLLEDFDVQFVQVGGGDGWLAGLLAELSVKFPDKVSINPYPNFTLPRLIFSGSDVILYPSRFEPCGIVQLEAMRYGSIPLVRKVGGLADTVENFSTKTKKGNGFVFTNFNEFSLFGQMIRAIELYKQPKLWRQLQVNAMKSDFSWTFSAREYVRLYKIAQGFKQSKHN